MMGLPRFPKPAESWRGTECAPGGGVVGKVCTAAAPGWEFLTRQTICSCVHEATCRRWSTSSRTRSSSSVTTLSPSTGPPARRSYLGASVKMSPIRSTLVGALAVAGTRPLLAYAARCS